MSFMPPNPLAARPPSAQQHVSEREVTGRTTWLSISAATALSSLAILPPSFAAPVVQLTHSTERVPAASVALPNATGLRVITHDEVIEMMADEIAKSNTQSKSEIQKEIRQQNDFTTLADTLENKYKPYFSEAFWAEGSPRISFKSNTPANLIHSIKTQSADRAKIAFSGVMSAAEADDASSALADHIISRTLSSKDVRPTQFSIMNRPADGQLEIIADSPLGAIVEEWSRLRASNGKPPVTVSISTDKALKKRNFGSDTLMTGGAQLNFNNQSVGCTSGFPWVNWNTLASNGEVDT
ncbi:MAG: hypothetical protein LCH98_18825 [Actinobacteria bacterium]|nr:hypothetical protein [Actinomycetota bacterium]